MKSLIQGELKKVLFGLISTIISMTLLAVWRLFDDKNFLFIQISIVVFLTYVLSLIFETKFKTLGGNSLVAALISFTMLTSLALNIDRSRSVQVVKWVHQISLTSKVDIEEIKRYVDLPPSEIPAITQRLKEQSEIGLLSEKDGHYTLSTSGKIFISVADFLAKVLSLNGYRLS